MINNYIEKNIKSILITGGILVQLVSPCSGRLHAESVKDVFNLVNNWKNVHPNIAMQIDFKMGASEIREVNLVASNDWNTVVNLKGELHFTEIQFPSKGDDLLNYFPDVNKTIVETDPVAIQFARVTDWRFDWTTERVVSQNCSVELTQSSPPYKLRITANSTNAAEIAGGNYVEYTIGGNGMINYCVISVGGKAMAGGVEFTSFDGADISNQIKANHIKTEVDKDENLKSVLTQIVKKIKGAQTAH
jgi:hypothetical protein